MQPAGRPGGGHEATETGLAYAPASTEAYVTTLDLETYKQDGLIPLAAHVAKEHLLKAIG